MRVTPVPKFGFNNIPNGDKVTFIIGNGFDINLGMKTRYSDMYYGYIKSPSRSKVIKAFKNELANQIVYDKWTDFEMAMAEYAKTLSSEQELIECVRDFKIYMVDHLKNEEKRIEDLFFEGMTYLVHEFDNSVTNFYNGFAPNVVNEINNILGNGRNRYNFLTFNYTGILEKFLNYNTDFRRILFSQVIHIHGTLEEATVLGVDNLDQLKNMNYDLGKRGQRNFVKTIFNDQYDKSKIEKAKEIITQSSVICVFGFSIGESDKTWRDALVDWLLNSTQHHIVFFEYDTNTYNRSNFDEIMEVEENKKEVFMKKLKINEPQLFEQIHIPVGYSIFNFIREINARRPVEVTDEEMLAKLNSTSLIV